MSLATFFGIISLFLETESMARILRDECFDRRYLEEENQKAFLRGLEQGRIEGYNKGFDEGEFQGFNQGRKQGYNDGFDDGEARGYENEYDKGYDKCKKKKSMTKSKKLMKMAIKLVTRKDFKKDMTIVKKNSMAQLLCFTIPPFKFLVPTQALKRQIPPFSRL